MDKRHECAQWLKEPPLPLSQEGLGQQTSPHEGHAKRERSPGHKGSPPPGQTWRELLESSWPGAAALGRQQASWMGGQTAQEKRSVEPVCLTCPPGGGQSVLGELL